jgi:WD40 repeat protein
MRSAKLYATLCFVIVSFTGVTKAQEKVQITKIAEFAGFYRGTFARDGKVVALLRHSKIKLANVRNGRTICTIKVPGKVEADSDFFAAAFSPDGKTLSASYDSWENRHRDYVITSNFYDTRACSKTLALKSPPSHDAGNYLSFSLDGRLFSASADVSRVWDLSSGKVVYAEIPADGYSVKETLMSADGRWLVSYAQKFVAPKTLGRLFVTDLKTKETRLVLNDWTLGFGFTADGRKLFVNVMGTRDSPKPNIKIYDVGSWELVKEFWSDSAGRTFAVSPDGKYLAGGDQSPFRISSAADGQTLAEAYHYKRTEADDLADRMHMITDLDYVEFSPDSKMLLTGGEDGTVKLWKLEFK